jgi:hypothetical protein
LIVTTQKKIKENILNPKSKDGENSDSLLLKMITLGKSHIVTQMIKMEAKTDLTPDPFRAAVYGLKAAE